MCEYQKKVMQSEESAGKCVAKCIIMLFMIIRTFEPTRIINSCKWCQLWKLDILRLVKTSDN